MDEQQKVAPARPWRSRAEVDQSVAEFEASGLSRTEFCRSWRLSPTWRGCRRREADLHRVASGPPWVGSGLAIALAAGRRIEIGRGFDGQTLVTSLRVLERI